MPRIRRARHRTHEIATRLRMQKGRNLRLSSLALSSLISPNAFPQVLSKKDLIPLPLFVDICLKKVKTRPYPQDVQLLHEELCQLLNFLKLLSIKGDGEGGVRQLWKLVIDDVIQMDRGIVLKGGILPCRLASGFQKMSKGGTPNQKLTDLGKGLGDFLYEMGWFKEAATVLKICVERCPGDDKQSCVLLGKLLCAQVKYSMYDEAKASRARALMLIENLEVINPNVAELAELYSALSRLSSFESKYKESFDLSMKALETMRAFPGHYGIHHGATLGILCQGALSCLNMLEFDKANILIKGALCLSKDAYGSQSTAYADALHVYGMYFSERDPCFIHQAVSTFGKCLSIRKKAFGYFNLVTAVTTTDLAHALDSTGFENGYLSFRESFQVFGILLPPSHLQHTAINMERLVSDFGDHGYSPVYKMVLERIRLQEEVLNKLIVTFGEENLEVGRHYKFLANLNMRIRRFNEAEVALLKGISIMESVAFKGSHNRMLVSQLKLLAVLYQHKRKQPEKAEPLLFRAIDTCVECFGESYSTLKYLYQEVLAILSESDPRHREISDKRRALLLEIQRPREAQNDEGEAGNLSTILESFFVG